MKRDDINEIITLLTTTNNTIQVQYCHKVLNHYILHYLPHVNNHPALGKKLKTWNIRVNARIIELGSGIQMPHTKEQLAEIGTIIDALQNTPAE